MIKKIKIKFLLLSMSALLVLLFILVASINLANYSSITKEADNILSYLSQHKGRFPIFEGDAGDVGDMGNGFGKDNEQTVEPNDKLFPPMPHNMSPELPYESRYFSVLLTQNGEILRTETGRIAAVDEHMASEYAENIFHRKQERGFVDHYRYTRVEEADTVRLIFLDCERQLGVFQSFLAISVSIALIGFLLVFLFLLICSERILRPIAESYAKQKQFITDAGHEIKTPLTIIHANVELLSMELGENEALADIDAQTRRLTSLTNDLVTLARMEEPDQRLTMIDFPIYEVIEESVAPFILPAKAQKKTLTYSIQPLLSLNGDEKSIRRLISLLMDNALKYSNEGGEIRLSAAMQGRSFVLTVQNTTARPVDEKQLPYVFDRFYRTDPSRSTDTGGHGIGLSVAKAIVTAHGGKILAWTKNSGGIFGITVTIGT